MTALFFGLYMLGLATGSRMFGYIHLRSAAVSRLKHIKLFQIVFTSCCIAFIDGFSLHSGPVIGGMIFLIAFLDGIEFPVADSILRGDGRSAHNSAGLLLFSDSAGAMLVGAISGLWLLPAFGMQKCFLLLCGALTINYAALLIFSGKIHKA
jgi:predicted membrane-bound spermidine synthase